MARREVSFSEEVVVHELFETGHDDYTFDNVDSSGQPRVSQTQPKNRLPRPPRVARHAPTHAIWAHSRASEFANGGQGAMIQGGNARTVIFAGRRPTFVDAGPDSEDMQIEFHAEQPARNYEYFSYKPMAFWTADSVFFFQEGDSFDKVSELPHDVWKQRYEWNHFCHGGDVPGVISPPASGRRKIAGTTARTEVVEWCIDSGAALNVLLAGDCSRARFRTETCVDIPISGVGGHSDVHQ